MNGLLTVAQAAKILKVDPETIRRWLFTGRLAGSKPGGYRNSKWLIKREALDSLINAETGAIGSQASSVKGEK